MKHLNMLFSFWFSLKQPIRFILVGGYNTLIAYILFAIIYYILQNYILSLTFSVIISILNNFIVLKIFVFESKNPILKELLWTYISYSGTYILNLILLWFLINYLCFSAYTGQLMCSIIISIISYFFLKYTFKK